MVVSPQARGRFGAALLVALLSLAPGACRREPEPTKDNSVRQDVKDVARATEKTVKDATNKLGASGQDAWITTKVKSELTARGVDPLHVHVDTKDKIVTLSGTVESAAEREKAVAAAHAIKDAAGVVDHLFAEPKSK